MSRYRKIEVRTWSDEKFRSLSPMAPSGQALWFFLLTGPHTGPIPGLFRAGKAAMAEELGWSTEAFDKAFQEAFKLGMVKADFNARLVWLPNSIKHNKPESPNVVKSWVNEFDLLPECALKIEAFEEIKSFIFNLSEGYSKAFQEAFKDYMGKTLPKPLAKTMPNQEQEQEQEQETAAQIAKSAIGLPLMNNGFFAIKPEQLEKLKTLYPDIDCEQELRNMIGWFDANPEKLKPRTAIMQFVNSWLANRQTDYHNSNRADLGDLDDTSWAEGLVLYQSEQAQ